jgi:hypothetical protein
VRCCFPLWPLLLSCRPVLWRGTEDTGQVAAIMAIRPTTADLDGAIMAIRPTTAATMATEDGTGSDTGDTGAEATMVGMATMVGDVSSILSGRAGMPRALGLGLLR